MSTSPTQTRSHETKDRTDSNRSHRPLGKDSSGFDTPHTDELRENLSEVGSSLRRAVSQTVPAAKEVFNRISDDVVDRTTSVEEALVGYIREKPFSAMLIGTGIGLLLGLFLRRR